MRRRIWITAIVMSAVAVGMALQADADPREKQQSLQKLAREIVQSARVDPQQQQDYEQDGSASWDWRIRNTASGASFYVPQTLQKSDGLWYNLGWCQIDNLTFAFDEALGADAASMGAVPAPSPVPAPATAGGSATLPVPAADAAASPAPQPADDEVGTPDMLDYPLKAQLLVELVREYGSRPVKRQGARPLKLDDGALRQIEQIAQEEIKAIEAAQRKSRQAGNTDGGGDAALDDVTYVLQDYDARITRLVMAQLDAQADKRGVLLRKNRDAGAAGGAEPVEISLQFPTGAGEPNRVLVMCGGNFDYLKSTWNTTPETNLEDKRWKQVHWEKTENKQVANIPPGRQALVAVWEENGKVQFARAHKYPDVFKGNESVVFDAPQPAAAHN